MRCTIFSTIGVVAVAFGSAAYAADMPRGPVPAYGQPVQEFFSNWYLRLDTGYRFNELSGGQALGAPFSATSFKDAATFGGGVGYQWGWFRGDITADYGGAPKFVGDTGAPSHVTAKLSSTIVLANAYIDMGTWWGFTPYVGAGIGASFLKPTHFELQNALGQTSTIGGDGKWTFAWAAMAGLSYAIGPSFLVDASYRYVDLGEARSSVYTITPPSGDVTYGKWTAQEVRLGLRYLIP